MDGWMDRRGERGPNEACCRKQYGLFGATPRCSFLLAPTPSTAVSRHPFPLDVVVFLSKPVRCLWSRRQEYTAGNGRGLQSNGSPRRSSLARSGAGFCPFFTRLHLLYLQGSMRFHLCVYVFACVCVYVYVCVLCSHVYAPARVVRWCLCVCSVHVCVCVRTFACTFVLVSARAVCISGLYVCMSECL